MNLVLVGAGMAGSILAHALSPLARVTVIELSDRKQGLAIPMRDSGVATGYFPSAGSGPGGTTAYWHNGLIEPMEDDFAVWPFSKAELEAYLERAYPILSGVTRATVMAAYRQVRDAHLSRGIPAGLPGNALYYPRRRRNVWLELRNRASITVVIGRARRLVSDGGHVTGVAVETAGGMQTIPADMVVCCAGGLSTPLILQETADAMGLDLPAIGRFYHDHPTGFVGEVRLKRKFYDIWNFTAKGLEGSLRTPLVVRDGQNRKMAFYLRPAAHLASKSAITSVLSDLRNSPFKVGNVFRLLRNPSDIMEFTSFMAGIHVPTSRYSILIAAEQAPADDICIARDPETGGIVRNWRIDAPARAAMRRALDDFCAYIAPLTEDVSFYPDWDMSLTSGAHHSGTCRLARNPAGGVCDADQKIWGLENAFVCDGSLIPSSGFANTGLTIAALALRLSDHLKSRLA